MTVFTSLRAGACAATALALGFGASVAAAASFYVSPTGTSSTAAGTGTISNPWNLRTALAHPSAVRPGDTIWLRGGTYRGKFVSHLMGTAGSPIVVRAFASEWAKIDSGTGNPDPSSILLVSGNYTWFWGIELMSSDPKRNSAENGSWPTDITRGDCANTDTGYGIGVKFINVVCHDASAGINPWKDAADAEVYGSLIYYNGWNGATDGGHGHGLYVQNVSGSKFLTDNIIFQNFSHGLHAYTEGSFIDNIQAVGNTTFLNGDIAITGTGRNLLIGGAQVAKNPVVRENLVYFWPGGPQSSFDLGYSAGCTNPTVVDNYIGDNSYFVNCPGGVRTGNTFAGMLVGFTPSQYPSNTYILPPARPTGTRVFVRPNRYEAGRANITVFNWNLTPTVAVDVSSVLSVGAAFEVRNAQNYFAAPVLSGVYGGGMLTLPMTGLTVAAPVGRAAPPASGPEFNAFVLLAPGSLPPPAPTASFTFSPAAPQTNVSVRFTDTSTGNPTGWLWDFGDGATSTTRNPSHTYAVAGTYSARLTASNASGSNPTTRSVTVTAPPIPATPAGFYPLAPCRLVDTRNPNGPVGGPALAANSGRSFPATLRCGIPATARSIAVIVTAVAPAAGGYLQAYPGNLPVPQASVLNFGGSKTRAGSAFVTLATDGTGTIRVRNGSAGLLHLIVDVNGYFK